ncbi:MAG: DUF692 family protein [Anaerolineae bacterium]|nr:DUF692 family protein [Anaerolineae bacterium]
MQQISPHPWPTIEGRPLLGANGTSAMQALLAEGKAHLVDYLKVGPFMGREAIAKLAPHYPLMLHLDDTLSGHEPLPQEAVERILDLVQLTGTPWTSTHIGFSVADVTLNEALITQAASKLLSREQALENIVRNARALAEALPVPLLLENIPLFPNLAHLHVCEPDFIATVIAETGCGFLLDLAHARVSADVLGYEVHDYLQRLPLAKVVEIHLSGPRPLCKLDERRQKLVRENAQSIAHLLPFGEENLVDAHEPLQEEDYALLSWALERTQPRAISLEYFRQPGPLEEQLRRLGRMLGR